MSLLQQLASEATQNVESDMQNTNPEQVAEAPVTAEVETEAEPVQESTPDVPVQETPPAEVPAEQIDNAPAEAAETPSPQTSLFANEELERFNAFVLKTGKSWEEFQALNKPTAELSPKDLLSQYYSEKEGMTEKEIAYELSKLVLEDDDLDFDDEDEIAKLRREVELEREIRKASEWRENYVQDINTNLGTAESDAERLKQSVQEYRETIYSAIADIKPMELDVNGQKVAFVPDEDFTKTLSDVAYDFGIATNEYFDADGKLKNSEGWLDFVSWAHKPTREAKLKMFAKQVAAQAIEAQSKQRRNVTPDNYQAVATDSKQDNDALFLEWRAQQKKSPFG